MSQLVLAASLEESGMVCNCSPHLCLFYQPICVWRRGMERRERERGEGTMVSGIHSHPCIWVALGFTDDTHMCIIGNWYTYDTHISWVQIKPSETSLPSNLTLILETGLQGSLFILFPWQENKTAYNWVCPWKGI